MRLVAGQVARDFSTYDVWGNPVSLRGYAGHPLLLRFFRYASCPMCNLRLHDFVRNYPRLEAQGMRAVAFFHSPAQSIRRHAGKQTVPFPLVADPDREIYRSYGVEQSWWGFLKSVFLPSFYVDFVRASSAGFWGGWIEHGVAGMPADFLIGPDGVIRQVYYGRDIGDHLSTEQIQAALA